MASDTDTRSVKATCLCHDVSFDITLSSSEFPLQGSFCSCDSCRHMTGTLFLSPAFLPPSWQPSSAILEKLTSFEFSKRITQYFCNRCGSTMLAHCLPLPSSDRAENWDIMSGTLETLDGIVNFKGYGFVHDTLDGGFADFLPSLNGRNLYRKPYDDSADDPELPLYWRESETPNSLPPNARLPAYCKCKGVQFFIARPSPQSTQASRPWPDLLIPHYEQSTNKNDPAQETWWLRANKTKFLAGLCSCDSCRLASGMEITPWAFIPRIDISLDPEGKVPFEEQFGTLQSYNSSKGVTRHFCSKCGAIVFYADSERDITSLLDVAAGLLNAPEGARAETWLEWRTERLSFREDAFGRATSLVEGIEKGLKEFRDNGHGRLGPVREVSEALGMDKHGYPVV